MARIYDDITKTIGNTPLVRVNRIMDGAKATSRTCGNIGQTINRDIQDEQDERTEVSGERE